MAFCLNWATEALQWAKYAAAVSLIQSDGGAARQRSPRGPAPTHGSARRGQPAAAGGRVVPLEPPSRAVPASRQSCPTPPPRPLRRSRPLAGGYFLPWLAYTGISTAYAGLAGKFPRAAGPLGRQASSLCPPASLEVLAQLLVSPAAEKTHDGICNTHDACARAHTYTHVCTRLLSCTHTHTCMPTHAPPPAATAGLLISRLSPMAAGSGIPAMRSWINGVDVPRCVAPSTLAVKAVGVALAIAAGLVAGKEGPYIQVRRPAARGTASWGSCERSRGPCRRCAPLNWQHGRHCFASPHAVLPLGSARSRPNNLIPGPLDLAVAVCPDPHSAVALSVTSSDAVQTPAYAGDLRLSIRSWASAMSAAPAVACTGAAATHAA
jgi:hypothetical protein